MYIQSYIRIYSKKMMKTLLNTNVQNNDFDYIEAILTAFLTIKFMGAYALIFIILGYILSTLLKYTNIDETINNNIANIENIIRPIIDSKNWVYIRPTLYTIFVSSILLVAV